MSLFDDVLKENETLFQNDTALDYEFIPKQIPYREAQQKRIATCIAPLISGHSGRNILVYGPPGVGKTVATKHVLNELEEKYDSIIPIYVNCWLKNTSYKVILEICNVLDYKFTHNKKTDELFEIVAKMLNKFSTVFVFDEIDKADDLDFLYLILQHIHKKSIVLLSNYKDIVSDIDMRIRSRLTPELLEFQPYSKQEIEGIIEHRVQLAFYPNVWKKEVLSPIISTTFDHRDIRVGLYLIREAALNAESKSLKQVDKKSVEESVSKLQEFKIKDQNELEDTTKNILAVIKKHSPAKIGNLYKVYDQDNPGSMSYKTFTRKIAKLEEGKFITVQKTEGGAEGNTSIISYNTAIKTLDEF